MAQVGLAEQDEGEGGGGIHISVEPEAQFVQETFAEKMSFIDDDDRLTAALGEVGEGGVEALAETAGMKVDTDAESGEQVGKEGLDGEVGVGEVSGEIEVGVQGMNKGAHGGGLAGANSTGDESREAILQGESQAGLEFLVRGGGKEIAHGHGFVKG